MKIKNIIKSGFIFCSMLSFAACNQNIEYISSYYAEGLDSFIYADNNKVIDLANNKQDFILFLYSDCGCGGNTDSVIATFQTFIKETNLVIYAIGASEYKKIPLSLESTFPLYPTSAEKEINDIPLLYFYNDGKLSQTKTYTPDFKSVDKIKNIIFNVVLKNGYYLLNKYEKYTYETYDFYTFNYQNTELLDEKIQSEKVNDLYTWYKCGDCHSLKKYLKNTLNNNWNKLYLFEVDYFRNSDNKETLWDDEINGFPYKYEFSSYRGGKVPAIVSYENGNKIDYIIYHNDVINNNVVQESFFEELIGNSYSEEELETIHQEKIKNYIENME